MSAAGAVTRKSHQPGSIVFGSGTTAPFAVGHDGKHHQIVDGWYLEEFEHCGDDCFKVTYDAINVRTGARVALNWSPYQVYTDAHFVAMVAMGFPKGVPSGPNGTSFRLYPYDVDDLYTAHLAAGGKRRAA